MFLTTCLGVSSAVVSTWICSTAPLSLSMILADTTPGSVRISSSARLMGSTLPAMLFKISDIRELYGKTGGQYYGRLTLKQAKNCTPPDSTATMVFASDNHTTSGHELLCLFRITYVPIRCSAAVAPVP